jgi:hypothetical protein
MLILVRIKILLFIFEWPEAYYERICTWEETVLAKYKNLVWNRVKEHQIIVRSVV